MKIKILIPIIFLALNVFAQTIIDKEVTCPTSMLETVKNLEPNFYFDKEYVKNLKLNDKLNFHILVKVPSKISEAKKMDNLEKIVAPAGTRLNGVSFYKLENASKDITLTFKNRNYSGEEVICIKVDGKVTERGMWDPKLTILADISILDYDLNKKIVWNGLKYKID